MVIVNLHFRKRWVLDWMMLSYWIISGLIISFSFYHQSIEKVEPCTLCKWQRLLYLTIFCISPFGLIQQCSQFAKKSLSILFLVGFSLATYHTLVQFGWLTDHCAISQNVETINDFITMLEQPKMSCAKIGWQLFGVSASIYSAFFSVIALICLNLIKLPKLRKKYVDNKKISD
jgi:disulfide bond formation protein DsbB